MADVYYYRLKCITEDDLVYVWNTEAPIVCPNDNTHTIDVNSITKINSVSSDIVEIKEETIPTGGNYKAETVIINTNANETSITDKTWIIPINMFAVYFITTTEHDGDNLIVEIAPDTIIGAITSDVNVNDTIIHVNDTVLDNLYIGYHVKLDDLTNSDDCGMVTHIDKINKTITINTPTTQTFSISTPTYIRQTIRMIDNFELSPSTKYSLGTTTIGGSYVPTGIIARVKYVNNSSNPKKLRINVEYLY